MCKYCDMTRNYKTKGMCNLPATEESYISIIQEEFYIEVNVNCCEYTEVIPIKYCPICGRRLINE